MVWRRGWQAFILTFTLSWQVTSRAQNAPHSLLLAVCEGDGCSRWEFASGQATGTWPDGASANLSIIQFPSTSNGSVSIRRVDTDGVGKGIDGTYTGTRKGSIIEGKVSWKWPGHPDGHGDWFAVIMADALHMAPETSGNPVPIPSSFNGCEDGHVCDPWILNGKTGTVPGQANLTVERFDDSRVVIRRTEISGSLNGMEALYIGIRKGNDIHGVAVWKWSGQPPVGAVGWHASLPDKPEEPSIADFRDGPAPVGPPNTMHICSESCETLTLAGDHYQAVLDDNPKAIRQFKIVQWKRTVELATTEKSADGADIAVKYSGTIADSGDHLQYGNFFSKESDMTAFRATWGNARSAPDLPSSHRSKTHPNILLPEGATETYATYDNRVRAMLKLSNRIDSYDARRTCKDVSLINDPRVAVDIARYAYRADEIERGNCWATRAVQLDSPEGEMLIALGWLFDWHGKADTGRACREAEKIGTRDAWAMAILADCYLNSDDPQFPKDAAKLKSATDWLLAHAKYEMDAIDYDDLDVQRKLARQKLIDDPPMRDSSETRYCQHVAGDPSSCPKTGYYSVPVKVVDQAELQRRLREVDERYASIK